MLSVPPPPDFKQSLCSPQPCFLGSGGALLPFSSITILEHTVAPAQNSRKPSEAEDDGESLAWVRFICTGGSVSPLASSGRQNIWSGRSSCHFGPPLPGWRTTRSRAGPGYGPRSDPGRSICPHLDRFLFLAGDTDFRLFSSSIPGDCGQPESVPQGRRRLRCSSSR